MNISSEKSIYRIIKLVMFAAEVVLFAVSINIIIRFNIDRFSAKQIVNVAFDIVMMLILMIIYVSILYGRENDSSYSFVLLLFSVYTCLFFELGAWMVDGLAASRVLNYLFNIGCNSMMIGSTLMFFNFTCKSLEIDQRKASKTGTVVTLIAILGVAAELLNIKYGFFYYIDRYGVYARNHVGSTIGYIPFLCILAASIYFILGKDMSWRSKGLYLSYMFVPFLASGWYMITECPPTFFVTTAFSTVLIYANIYVRIGSEATKYELENAYKEVELALQKNRLTLSQIKPHFIFNALGSIEELCVVDAKKAEEAVHYFSKYLRANMDALGEKDLTPFEDELDHIHNYIWLEKMRFEDDLDYCENIEVSDFSVPILCIQPLIENAVKHGMMRKEEGTLHVTLTTKKVDEYVEIIITDDGCGFDTKQKKDDGRSHVGMEYARKSIESKLNGQVRIESEIGKGTVVTMRVPIM